MLKTMSALLFASVFAVAEEEIKPEDLSAKQFINQVQLPFLEHAWGKFSGEIQGRIDRRAKKLPITLALRFQPTGLRGQLIVNERDIYNILQVYSKESAPKVNVFFPTKPSEISISDLGVKPEDFTFSFLYWELIKELEPDSFFKFGKARVLLFQHPKKEKVTSKAWISEKYFFPLKIEWYENGTEEPTRTVIIKAFKKFEREIGDRKEKFYFIKKVSVLNGDQKAVIEFEDADLFSSYQKVPPQDLFVKEGE